MGDEMVNYVACMGETKNVQKCWLQNIRGRDLEKPREDNIVT
jgi:hypothetical protein